MHRQFRWENHIRIIESWSNWAQGLIYLIQTFSSNTKTVSKNLIEYNSNDLVENDEEEKEPIDIEFTEQKNDYENDENAIDFWWPNV